MSGVDLALAKLDEQRKTSEAPTELGEKPKRRPGRTTIYTEELIAELMERYSQGESIEEICEDEHMPSSRTVHRWNSENATFAAEYARAKTAHQFARVHRVRRIIKGDPELSTGDTLRDKMLVDVEFRVLRAVDPKVWGDKVAHEHSGGVIAGTIVIGAAVPAPKVIEGRVADPDMLPKSGSGDDDAS